MKRISLFFAAAVLSIILLISEAALLKAVSGNEPEKNVIFAKNKISEGAVIKPEMLQERRVAHKYIHELSVQGIDEIAGKTATADIEAGEMILRPKAAAAEELVDPPGPGDKSKRLFSVEFKPDQANGWWLMTGNYVDIIFVANDRTNPANLIKMIPPGGSMQMPGCGPADPAAQAGAPAGGQPFCAPVRMEKIKVAALLDDKGRLIKNNERSAMPKYVSFEVTPGQCAFLAFAKSNGRIEISVAPGG